MKDMANERDAVCRKLREFSMEPVNAEGWLPDGTSSWDRIEEELSTSDLFLLLLGETYGWVPRSGPKSDSGKSVTEIEYLEARKQAIPVLPFIKNLPYEAERASKDAKQRDAFRKRVMEWEDGLFVAKFDLAIDLAEKVAKALIQVITREYLKSRVRARLAAKEPLKDRPKPDGNSLVVPEKLIEEIIRRRAVLFAGSGMSVTAGLPTAAAFAEHLRESIREIDPAHPAMAASFADAAADFEALTSRRLLVAKVNEMLRPPQGLNQTSAHATAVKVFDRIFTTNWDSLFEQSLQAQSDNRLVILSDLDTPLPDRVLVKLHGSLDHVPSLLITDTDISKLDVTRAKLWTETLQLLRERMVVVVGMSLRDPSLIRLFEETKIVQGGYFVAPLIDAATRARLARWNLTCIEATSEAFFAALSEEIAQRS